MKKATVILLVGSDITSHLIANVLAEELLAQSITPVIFFIKHINNNTLVPEINRLSIFERHILKECINPILDKHHDYQHDSLEFRTPSQLKTHFGIVVEEIDNINDPIIVDRLSEMKATVVLSIRCYQKLSTNCLYQLKKSGAHVWNLHPGILPHYRGVMTLVRAMANGDLEFGYTLHEMNMEWDAGSIIKIEKLPISYENSMLYNLVLSYPVGVNVAFRLIQKVVEREVISPAPQDKLDAHYYSFPTNRHIQHYHANNLKLVQQDEMILLYIKLFSSGSEKISLAIEQSIHEFLDRNNFNNKEAL